MSKSSARLLLLLASALVTAFRAPGLLLAPRFWAEEGAVYFSYAFRRPWYEVLLASHLGYYALYPNLASLAAARTVELAYAPLVTTLLALAAQLIPLAFILWSRSDLWLGPVRKVIGILIVIFTLSSGEIWLNTINSQFFFSLTTFLILLEPVEGISRRRQWLTRTLLVISGLTGPGSCFLSPLFLFKAWRTREREAGTQAGILATTTLIQLSVFLTTLNRQAVVSSRFEPVNLPSLITIVWTKSLILPLFGPATAEAFAAIMANLRSQNMHDFSIVSLVLVLVTAVLFHHLSRTLDSTRRILTVGSYGILTVGSTILAIGPKFLLLSNWFDQRYYYVPSIILLSLILSNIRFTRNIFNPAGSLLYAGLFFVALSFGISYYRPTVQVWLDESWPRWGREVAVWQANPQYQLKIWPSGWTVALSDVEVRYHDLEAYDRQGTPVYKLGELPWLDLLVRLEDERWYGPERAVKVNEVLPLPQGYRWETRGGFSSLPNGEAWWNGTGPVGEAILYGPNNRTLQRVPLRIEFQRPFTVSRPTGWK